MRKYVLVLVVFFFCSLNAQSSWQNRKYDLSICSVFKNESRFLKEWIEYHLLAGVDHFYLYNIGSTDSYLQILKPYMKAGKISLIQWKDLSMNIQDEGICVMSTIIPAYENALRYRAIGETRWLAFVDVDEFLVPPIRCDLKEILQVYKDLPAVILPSENYDAGDLKQGKLLIEALRLANPPTKSVFRKIEKTIFKPESVIGFTWPPYQFTFQDEFQPLSLAKEELRINHYLNRKFRSASLQRQKIIEIDPRFCSEGEISKWIESGFQLEDKERAIYRFVPELLHKMGFDSRIP